MSWYSFITWGCYGFDTTAYDEADAKVEKYTKLLNKLNDKISDYEKIQPDVEDRFDDINAVINCYNDGTSGYWVRFYSDKVDQWKSQKNSFYNKMDDEFEYAKQRRDRVSELKDNWTERKQEEETSLNNQLQEYFRKLYEKGK